MITAETKVIHTKTSDEPVQTRRTDTEIARAIELITMSRDGLKQMHLEAHAAIVDGHIDALLWVMGAQGRTGDMLMHIEAEINSVTAVNN